MDQWTKERVCVACGRAFQLSDHGHESARAAAELLEGGTVNPAELPALVAKCPACCGAQPMSEADAVAAAMRIGESMGEEQRNTMLSYVRMGGAVSAGFGFAGILLVQYYAHLKQGAYNPALWTVVCALLIIGGVAASVWAFLSARKKEEEWL